MDIKTSYKKVINEGKQGEELYFEAIPTKAEREDLKNNGYRWHNVKKCWYRRLDYKKQDIKSAKIGNYLGVKVGDIFHYSWGYDQTNVNYFQVVALKGEKSVVVREIGYKVVEIDGYESYKVEPVKDDFLSSSMFIDDNIKGATKVVKGLKNGTIYINIESFGFCTLWDNKSNMMTCYA